MSIAAAALNMALAMVCGALIGSERQVRQRMAGLRTNALVALGAAGFVVFAAQFPGEVSPTRVAAQVVSGIGFLGAGIIFRHGFTIHGLNTAATLWCSAAVGLMAGAGAAWYALVLTGLIVFVNLGLRQVVKWLKRKTKAGVPLILDYQVRLQCNEADEAEVRATILRCFALPGLMVRSINRVNSDGAQVELEVMITGDEADEVIIEQAIGPLMIDPRVLGLSWESSVEG